MEARAEHPRGPGSVFVIGVDLGTTNSAVAFVDSRRRGGRLEHFGIPQLVDPHVVESRPLLPSFLYFPEAHEIDSGAMALPWNASPDAIAGTLARDRGSLAPARLVSSAKSWLAHPGVDRRAPILPWGAASGPRISPVDASARYLAHLRDAWNATTAAGDDRLRFEHQRIILTVPASFDEEARDLTVEAARAAGFSQLTLLEEPVAAFYAWMSTHRGAAGLEDGRVMLVCDVGGGTTDFSLIRIRIEDGAPAFERIAIGEHLLLGGDNVDLALAALLERRLAESRPEVRLAITQRAALRRSCTAAKERLLGDDPPDAVSITALGAGRALIGSAITLELTRTDVLRTLGEFLPATEPGEMAAPSDRRAGLREIGLPYETDPAITRQLATFLVRAATAIGEDPTIKLAGGRRLVRPDLILFNGGFFTPAAARDRVIAALAACFADPPAVLPVHTNHLKTAVASGAATYGRLRAGIGPAMALVKAGSGRSYYVGLGRSRDDGTAAAICLLARGAEEGTRATLDHSFSVAANRPVAFSLYSSIVRSDKVGDVVSLRPGDDAREHAALVTVLRYGRKSRHVELPVRLSVEFTEVGTLALWCESKVSDHRWRLQFELRRADNSLEGEDVQDAGDSTGEVEPEHGAVVHDEAIAGGEGAIRAVFQGRAATAARAPFDGGAGVVTPENLVAHLEQITGYGKAAWPLPVIRRFADALIGVAEGRRGSAALEARWLNLFGFCIRPGFGAAKDPWRVGEARKVYAAGLAFPNAIQNRVEWLVLWQRAAGGFSAGQQRELAQRVMGELGLGGKKPARLNAQMERESWRLLASLERLDAGARVRIGDALLVRLRRDPQNPSYLWSFERLGARGPLYGPLSSVVPPEDARRWIESLIGFGAPTPEQAAAIVQIAARTGDPLRDIDHDLIDGVRRQLLQNGFDPGALRPLDEVVTPSHADASRVFGEPLPVGLQLHADTRP